MNKKGFTFIELLAILVLIGIIIVIAVPSIRLADQKTTEKTYETKLKLIKTAATDYGDDFKENIVNASTPEYYTSSGVQYIAKTITIRELLNAGYLSSDADISENDIKDPRNKSSMLNRTITIYIKNNRAYAKLNF